MKLDKTLLLFFVLVYFVGFGQKSMIYTNELVQYNHALDLYQNRDYDAAQILFKKIKNTFDDASELKAVSYYYEAFCAIRLGQKDGDDLMKSFFEKYPTSTKRNTAYLEVSDYYFKNGKYAYALKWYAKVNPSNLTSYSREEFLFNKAYSFFAVGSYVNAKKYFSQLLDSPKYGPQAKYYYGFMAYKDDDFAEADKYLNQAADAKSDKDIDYFLINIKFKTGKFQEAIDDGLPLLKKSNGIQKSELSKIIGESYFNLEKYEQAVPYLLEYKGKKGKWNNTDFYQLGYAYYLQKDYENAILWFTKIIDGNNAVSQNAYYHLAESYLKAEKKQEALNAFRNTKQMDFDASIKKEAWLNYAKLSYEIGNPYKSKAEVIQDYLAAYPEEDNKELKNLLINAFVSTQDFQGALKQLEKEKDYKTSEIYQKIAYLRGVQLFTDGDFEKAIQSFNLSLESSPNSNYRNKSVFWKAESDYRLNNFENAVKGFEKFINDDSQTQTIKEKQLVNYNLAYTYFKLKDYNKAGGYFRAFIDSNPNNKQLLNDSYLRLGDCFFALGNYYKAIPPYKKVIEANDTDVDYAQLQVAMSQGFLGDLDSKINSLLAFTKENLKSTLRDDAFYELGNSYVKNNENQKAISAYNNVITQYRMSFFAPKALLKQGLVYYNTSQNEKALSKYKLVINNYPATPEAKEAITNAKQIYIDLGRVDEYETMVKNVDYIDLSDNELDNTMFASAEQFYLANQYKKAIEGFQKYLKRFPKGANAISSNFYLAESLTNNNQIKESIPYYNVILNNEGSEFSNPSLLRVAKFYLETEDWEKAIPLLNRIEKEAATEQNRTFAQSNLMKGNYALKNFKKAVSYAEIVLNKEKLEPRIKSDAEIIIARSAFETKDFLKAQEYFKKVEKTASGKLKAEAVYYDAYFKNEEGNYKISNQVVQKLASELSVYKYWGGKGLIIMAKNFYELEDAYQATYILESVISKFSDYKDIVNEAKAELIKIKKKESKTNASVIIDNKP